MANVDQERYVIPLHLLNAEAKPLVGRAADMEQMGSRTTALLRVKMQYSQLLRQQEQADRAAAVERAARVEAAEIGLDL